MQPSTPPESLLLLERCSFPPAGTAVDCAVSGGPDSMSLLVLARAAGCKVTALHVDHQLRAESAVEAEIVARAAKRFGAEFRSLVVSVDPGPNLEERARKERYAALPTNVMTGHTADDQAETVLINMMRGAGIDGLAGMRSSTQHPIMQLRKHETRELCAQLGIDIVIDPSNEDPRILRNRVRHELMPLLNDLAHRDVASVLARQAEILRSEAGVLDQLAGEIDPCDAKAVSSAPPVLARRALRNWLRTQLDGDAHPPDAAAIDRVLDVAYGNVRACELAGGWRVVRSRQRLLLERAARR